MKKFAIQVGILTIVAFVALYFGYNPQILQQITGLSFNQSSSSETINIQIGTTQILAEVADSASERSKGLSGRDNLESDRGMLFIFPEIKVYQFWMKEMKFPLDLIFIRNGVVVDMIKNAQPPMPNQKDNTLTIYQPNQEIDMLLETNAGFIDQHQIIIGDSVKKII